MLDVYDAPGSGNGYKVRLLLDLLGIPYRTHWLNILKGETRHPDFLAINPNGKIPAVVLESGEALSESDALLFYFAQGTSFWPETKLDQTRVLQWMFFEQYSHEPAIAVLRFWLHFLPADPDREAMIPAKRSQSFHALGVMEGRLAQGEWLVGSGPTIADIALYAYTHVAHEADISLEAFPHIRAWIGRIEALPGWRGMMDGVPFEMSAADLLPAEG